MKKFIRFTLCLLLSVITLGLTACGGSKGKERVDTSVASNGNGGMVVTRGDYVYFVNGYSSYKVYTTKNLDKKFTVGGLYRAKVNDNAELTYNEDGSLANAEQLSSGLAGFESTSLYVFGNYIYYTTPTAEVNKKGDLKTAKLDFYRVNINGGKAERVYRSSSNATNIDFEYYYADGSVYLMINENGTLRRVKGYGDFNVNVVDRGIETIVLHRDTDDVFESDSYKNIFYTKTNTDGAVEIYNYNIAKNKNEYKATTYYETCELVDYRFGHLYYKAKSSEYPNFTCYYRVDATKNAIMNLAGSEGQFEDKLTADDSYTDFYFLDNETDGYIAQSSDKTYYLAYGSGSELEATPIADSKLEIMAIKNNYIYFKSGNDIKRINYYNFKTKGDKTQESVLTIEGLQTYGYDIDADNLYVYATSGSNTYLYSIKVGNTIDGEDFEARLLGIYKDGDAPEVEE